MPRAAQLLADHIDSDIPIYGLPAIPVDEPQLPTIEELAGRFIKMMRDAQPEGPYRDAGWSLGGIFASEIAVQLLDQGQQVEFIGLFDCGAPDASSDMADGAHDAFSDLLETVKERDALAGWLDDMDEEQLWPLANRYAMHVQAGASYTPSPIACPIHLFAAREKRRIPGVWICFARSSDSQDKGGRRSPVDDVSRALFLGGQCPQQGPQGGGNHAFRQIGSRLSAVGQPANGARERNSRCVPPRRGCQCQ